MGQYHGIYNKTKKEYYNLGGAKLWEKASSSVASMGLMVLLCNSNGRGGGDLCNPIQGDYFGKSKNGKLKRLKVPIYTSWSNEKQKNIARSKDEYQKIESAIELASGRWAGDEIVIQGDYAEKTDPAYIPEDETENYRDVTALVVQAIELCCEGDEELEKFFKFERQFSRARF